MATTMSVPTWHRGDRLRKAREAAHIGSHEMAERMGVSRQTVTRWERGGTMSKASVRMWAEVTNVPPQWLAEGSDPASTQGTTSTICYVAKDFRLLWRHRQRSKIPPRLAEVGIT